MQEMIRNFCLSLALLFSRGAKVEIAYSGGSTDATEVMGARCDGQTSCSWEDEITNGIRDPCSDVFKYMTVDYECGKLLYYSILALSEDRF